MRGRKVSSMNNMQNSNRRTQINDLSDLDMGNRIDMNMRRNLQSGMDMRDGTDMRGGMDMNIKAANREACARLLHTIQMYSFVLLETNLYLDSHPNDQMAPPSIFANTLSS